MTDGIAAEYHHDVAKFSFLASIGATRVFAVSREFFTVATADRAQHRAGRPAAVVRVPSGRWRQRNRLRETDQKGSAASGNDLTSPSGTGPWVIEFTKRHCMTALCGSTDRAGICSRPNQMDTASDPHVDCPGGLLICPQRRAPVPSDRAINALSCAPVCRLR